MVERSRTYIAIPPGATIKEQLIDRNMSQKEFAVRMGLSEKHVSRLINGDVQLTIDVAIKLESVLGVPTQFWCNMEAIYREKLAKVNEEQMMDADIYIAQRMPYQEMYKNGWVVEATRVEDKVTHLRRYFELSQLKILDEMMISPAIECHKMAENENDFFAMVAWAQKAKLAAREIDTKPIDINALKETIPEIRKMTRMPAKKYCKRLTEVLASCGVAIAFLPYIEGTKWHGTTFLDGNKVVLGIFMIEKDTDIFWYNLFHELGHIVLDHISNNGGLTLEDDKAANEFATEMLRGGS